MTELLLVMVTSLVVIAAATLISPRLRIATPLLLVAIGVAASFLPVFAGLAIDPEWILEGVLPPLLYSSAVSMPAMNFRREFGAISGLSVLLVIGSALILGLFFSLVIPGLGFAWGVALGAIVSPTDAVAVSIIKKTSVSKRVIALLDGESLLNDATALVLLRTAVIATTASFSFWTSAGTFVYSVAVAGAIGYLVGRLNLWVRSGVTDPTVNTIISFTVPFVASVPTSLLGGSGLVAAVVAGLVTGIRAPRDLSPQNRLSDSQNWGTVELVLESAVFLTMGLQVKAIVASVRSEVASTSGLVAAILVAVGALVVTVAVRAAYVAPLLGVLRGLTRHTAQLEGRLHDMQEKMATPQGAKETFDEMNNRPGRRRTPSDHDLDRFTRRITMVLADIEYFRREPLGWREGAVVVWAGMRGAVTVAAAQTLGDDTPQRSVLVLVAFGVAALSLLLQGGTIGLLLRLVTPPVDEEAAEQEEEGERTRIMRLLRTSAETVPQPNRDLEAPRMAQFAVEMDYRMQVLAAQRSVLLDARDNGTFDADVLAHALADLDASQIAMEIRGNPA